MAYFYKKASDGRVIISCDHHGFESTIDIHRLRPVLEGSPNLHNVGSGRQSERPTIFFVSSNDHGRLELQYGLGFMIVIQPGKPPEDLLREFIDYLQDQESRIGGAQ